MPKHRNSFMRAVVFAAILTSVAGFCQSQPPHAGSNVNMVSGTQWPIGDPFLQRQNEPSLAVSTRNPLHMVAGANDYRTVDLAGLLNAAEMGEENGDAWLGLFKSFDGGFTWASVLIPGYPLDTSAAGTSSPIFGYQAAADPIVRAGSNGLIYYGGLAFNRTNNASAVFVTHLIDQDNKENGSPTNFNGSPTNVSPTDPILYLGTSVVAKAATGHFLDKPWMTVDIPRGAQKCYVSYKVPGSPLPKTETLPGGKVYLSYTDFSGSNFSSSKIMFTSSADCGLTWSTPYKISGSTPINQSAVMAVDPSVPNTNAATIYVAWRSFGTSSVAASIQVAKSIDGGATFSAPVAAVTFPRSCYNTPTNVGCPFDQGTTGVSFRTNDYPALAVDDAGRVYLAWSQRQPSGDTRIMLSISQTGTGWSIPALIDNGPVYADDGTPFTTLSGRGHQIMPSMTYNAGSLTAIWYDLRQDHTLGTFIEKPDLSGYSETRTLEAELTDLTNGIGEVFGSYIADQAPPLTSRRHTIDVAGAQGAEQSPGSLLPPTFNTFRVSNYFFGINPYDNPSEAEQLQVNPPNLPMFEQGQAAFMGDYIDVAGSPTMVMQNGSWVFNTGTANSPVLQAVWADNRNVQPPPNGDWSKYTPPYSASNPQGTNNTSKFDPTQTVQQCSPQTQAFVASRNQDIYTARIAPGLVVASPGNNKPLGFIPNTNTLLQRTFVLLVQNSTGTARNFQLTIANQPLLANGTPDPLGQASFMQFSPLTTEQVAVNPFSTGAEAVFVQSQNPKAGVTINVQEVGTGTMQATVTLNPDPTTPTLIDPDNPSIGNPSIGNPSIGNAEVYTPSIGNPSIGNPSIGNTAVINPSIGNPSIGNPSIGNPNVNAALNPSIGNPSIGNPSIGNPSIGNPSIGNQSVTDASYPITNTGNTTASYTIKLFQNGTLPSGILIQLIIDKLYSLPAAQGCTLGTTAENVIYSNVPNPSFATSSDISNPSIGNAATLSLAPGDTALITIRANVSSQSDMLNLVLNNITPVAVQQAVNTQQALQGITTPPVITPGTSVGGNLIFTTTSLPAPTSGTKYFSTIQVVGGTAPYSYSITSGALPQGLTLSPSTGAVSGSPTTPGTYTFTVQAIDSTPTKPQSASRAFTLVVNPQQSQIGSLIFAQQPVNTGAMLLMGSPVMVQALDATGAAVPGVSVALGINPSSNGNLCGITTATTDASGLATFSGLQVESPGGPYNLTATTDAGGFGQSSSFSVPKSSAVMNAGLSLVPSTPWGVATADLDGDGIPDLAVVTGSTTLVIMKGRGDGTFTALESFPTSSFPYAVAIADLNGDGIPDIAVAEAGAGAGSQVQIFTNLGGAKLSPGSPIPTLGSTPSWIGVADFNGDGKPDLVVTAAAPEGFLESTSILLNTGSGGFSLASSFNVPVLSQGSAVGDFNDDGFVDIAVAGAVSSADSKNVYLFYGKGDGTFNPGPSFTQGSTSTHVATAADVNHDGIADLIISDLGTASVYVLISNGDGTFANAVTYPTLASPYALGFADINQDGQQDLVVASLVGYGVSVLFGNGDGTFQPHLDFPTIPGAQQFNMAIADYNGDGLPDIALSNINAATIPLLLQKTNQIIPVQSGDACWTPYFSAEDNLLRAAIDSTNPASGGASLDLARPKGSETAALLHEANTATGFGPRSDLVDFRFDFDIDQASYAALPPDIALRVYPFGQTNSFFMNWNNCANVYPCDNTMTAGEWQNSGSLLQSLTIQGADGNPPPASLSSVPPSAPINAIHVRSNYDNGEAWHGWADDITIRFKGRAGVTYVFGAPQNQGSCMSSTPGFIPFSTVYYTTKDSAGDTFVVGGINSSTYQQIQGLPIQNASNQQYCGTIMLESNYLVPAYVPAVSDRSGDFSGYAGLVLTDPFTGGQWSGNHVPENELQSVFVWRIPPHVAVDPLGCNVESVISVESTVATSIEFNNLTSSAVNVYWIDYNSQPELYFTLSAGQSQPQPTYVTHPWLVKDSAGQCLGYYLPTELPGTVTIQ